MASTAAVDLLQIPLVFALHVFTFTDASCLIPSPLIFLLQDQLEPEIHTSRQSKTLWLHECKMLT